MIFLVAMLKKRSAKKKNLFYFTLNKDKVRVVFFFNGINKGCVGD